MARSMRTFDDRGTDRGTDRQTDRGKSKRHKCWPEKKLKTVILPFLSDNSSYNSNIFRPQPGWNRCYPCAGVQIVCSSPCASCANISIHFAYYLRQYTQNQDSFCAAAPAKHAACTGLIPTLQHGFHTGWKIRKHREMGDGRLGKLRDGLWEIY